MANDPRLDGLGDQLDQVYIDQLQVAAKLAAELEEHAAFEAFVHQLKLAALKLGTEAVVDALPFLQVALKAAILAA